MPRIKRWTPISHDFNRDPQIIQLRLDFGDWAALAWQELLHIADRNDGIVAGTIEQIAQTLAPVSLQKYQGRAANAAQTILKRFTDNSWITVRQDCIQIVKYAKYHRTKEPENVPPRPDRTRPEPDQTKNKRIHIAPNQNFPDEWKWLEAWVKKQNGGFPVEQFLNWSWWDSVSETCGGISESWLDAEAAKWKTWIMNNPARAPTPKGFRRFVSGWLQRSYEKERTHANGKR